MKLVLILLFGIGVVFLTGFFGGRVYQSLTNGYKLQVLQEESVNSPLGTVTRKQVMESIGTGFLDTDTSIIQLDDVTLYIAKRAFQDSQPVAQHLKAEGNTLTWDDGDRSYRLTVEPMQREAASDAATKP